MRLRTGFIPKARCVAAKILVSLCRSKIFLNTVQRRVVFSTTNSEGVFQEEGRSFFSGGRYDQQQNLSPVAADVGRLREELIFQSGIRELSLSRCSHDARRAYVRVS